jgi:RNA polymerase sigma factor (sigma-70 family)
MRKPPASDPEGAGGSGGVSPEAWVARLKKGDPEAVQEVRRRVRTILAFRGFGCSESDKDDLEQEVMTHLWRAVNRQGFSASAGFWGFVEVVTARRCIDWLREQRERVPIDGGFPDGRQTPIQLALAGERAKLATAVIDALDPACRELVVGRLRDGRSYSELAGRLGKSEGALRVQMYRCIQSARKILGKMAPESQGSSEG